MSEPNTSQRAVRLVFSYDGDDVQLVSQQRVDVDVTGFDTPQHERPGHFAEVRSADGTGLTRVPIRGAFHDSAEVFPENHDEPITRVPVESRSGAFTVVVPARDEARSVTVIRVDPPPPAQGPGIAPPPPAEPTELGTFELDA